ncbi:MAG: histidyl-tRNA synthetase, partial [Solirubrobacteraceae bacterium]|nr:histidyl-tRNA synthetase [Solirubrobacteraceae bacterium]
SGVGGGGRYDGLVERLGGRPTPGMGWAAGVERMMLAGDPPARAARSVDLFIALGSPAARRVAFALLEAARSAGLSAQMELAGRSLKGQLGHADALGARYVAIVEDGATTLKDLQDGGQEQIATETVVHAVLRALRTL